MVERGGKWVEGDVGIGGLRLYVVVRHILRLARGFSMHGVMAFDR